MLTNELFYNSILLYHVNKKGGDMKADLNKILAKDNLTVDKLLNSTAKDFIKTNANEVMGTTQVGFGKEFVQETILSSELIERLQTNGSLLVDATIKLMTGKSLDIPVKGRRLRMTIGTEKVNAPTGGATDTAQVKKAGTASINLTAKKMNITIYYYDEWLEDSVIAVAEYILNAIYEAYESSIHEVLLNGDTETGANANINIID
jgi:HK97 family phage major capsid protein